jgi:hypothetical protein
MNWTFLILYDGKTYELMEEFCSAISAPHINRTNTGKDDDTSTNTR